ncbi:MAG: adenylate/guanylate cyclase domain-containing protein [Phaeodactylibacter sp.]|nr:adenylate/guanylate cyclase domain-containing protein [Phaeodactylibacter sp.]
MDTITSNKFKSGIIKILWITLGWTAIAAFQFWTVYANLVNFNCDMEGLPFTFFLKNSIRTGIMAGILGGSTVVFIWEEWLRAKNYAWALLSIFWSYSLLYVIISFINGILLHGGGQGHSIFDSEPWRLTITHLLSGNEANSYIFWLFVVLGTLIILQVRDKYGPGTFTAFLLGKYFRPKREERIFMFLDLRSSTSIAEQLGEELYFDFLKNVFQHATPAIINTKGEIYQYVGDEIVISWKMDRGLENANCIRCFFDIQLALRRKAAYYQKTYGITPEFKAGLHYGYVMAGEVGVVKRDIAFSGDVLNTAARIQGKCNELGVNILLSKFLLDKLALPPHSYEPRKIGGLMLRGKQEKVVLYTI